MPATKSWLSDPALVERDGRYEATFAAMNPR